MAHLKQCSRSAAISFCPSAPYLAVGTVAGVMDMSFSNSSTIEVFDTNFANGGTELKVAAPATVAPERFQKIAWGGPTSADGKDGNGLIAGGLADGRILVWRADSLLSSQSGPKDSVDITSAGQKLSPVARAGGLVYGLQFNSLHSPHLLASGGADSPVTIWNLLDMKKPTSYPALKVTANGKTSHVPETTAVAWNHKADHILASWSGGVLTVHDLKQQKPRSSLRDDNRNPRRCSSLAWHPTIPTQVVCAYEDDNNPVMQLWDLRSPSTYLHEYVGHQKGILALSWCLQDPSMILTTGKDSQTILWDVNGTMLGGLTTPSNYFDIQFSPTDAGIFATSSYGGGDGQDGTVSLHSLASLPAIDTDPTGGYTGSGQASGSLRRVPNWLRRPAGASFGFGGKLVSFANEIQKDKFVNAQISLRQVTTENEMIQRSLQFEQAISRGDRDTLLDFCRHQEEQNGALEAETWKFLRINIEEDARRDLMAHLGFEGMLPPVEAAAEPEQVMDPLNAMTIEQEAPDQALPEGDAEDFFNEEVGADFFDGGHEEQLASPSQPSPKSRPVTPRGTANKMHMSLEKNEDQIQRALFVGNYSAALDACFEAGRMADALMIGHMGKGKHLVRAQTEYMRHRPHPFLQIVKAVMDNDLLGLIKARPLTEWKETLAILLSYATSDEWPGLCDALARRLAGSGNTHAATLAWICAGNVDQTITTWVKALQTSGVTVDGLQTLMERAVVLGLGAQLESTSPALAELLSQYASILASQGQMGMALHYLGMIPGSSTGPTGVLKYRIYYSGSPDIPADVPQPEYPFAEPSYQEAHQEPAATSSMGGLAQGTSTYDALKYSRGGSYGARQQEQGTHSVSNSSSYAQAGTRSQPYYNAYQQTAEQPPYNYATQGPVGGGNYIAATSNSIPQANTNLPGPPVFQPAKNTQPHAYAQSSYDSQPNYYQQPPPSTAYQQQPGQARQSQTGWQAHQAFPSAPVSPPSIVAAPKVFVPDSSSRTVPVPQTNPFVPGPMPSMHHQSQASQPMANMQPPAPAPAPAPAPKGPPPNLTISNADTSKAPADVQGVIRTIRGLYDQCAAMAQGMPSKKREMDDTSK